MDGVPDLQHLYVAHVDGRGTMRSAQFYQTCFLSWSCTMLADPADRAQRFLTTKGYY